MTFQGSVSIMVKVVHETKNIVLHSSDMNIIKVTFEGKDYSFLEYKPWQQIAIKFPEDLKKGQYVLNISYKANLSNSYDGFYNSSYVDTAGTKRYLQPAQKMTKYLAFVCWLVIISALLYIYASEPLSLIHSIFLLEFWLLLNLSLWQPEKLSLVLMSQPLNQLL